MYHIGIATLNSKYVHASLSPWCLSAGVKTFCTLETKTHILETTINQDLSVMIDKVLANPLDFLGFSCYIWNITQTEEVTRQIKEKLPHLPIVLGGPEVSFNPKEVLTRCPWVDFVLSGEGEETFPQLLTATLTDQNFTNILGLSYRKHGEIISNPPNLCTKIPPSPYCQDYFNQLEGKISYMESSRGCPYSCAFCLSGETQGVRYFPMDRVKKEIILLANSGTKTVKFIDRTFNSSVTHANEILQFILEEYNKTIPKHICFHFELAGDILKDSTLQLISKMPEGYVQLEIGMQSFSEKTLEAVSRKTNTEKLINNIKTLVSMDNHHLHIDLIAGLPQEDLETFKTSFNIAYNLKANMLQLGFLKVLKGSAIGQNPEQYPCDYHQTPPYQVISTPWLSENDFSLLEKIEDCVDRLYNSGRFTRTLAYVHEATALLPYDLYQHTALSLKQEKYPSLDSYVDDIFSIFSKLSGVSTEKLRDFLVLDRIETNSTANIPKSLMIQDPQLRALKIALEQNPETATPHKIKRFVGILYSQNLGVYVDYPPTSKEKQHFFRRYESKFVSLDILHKEQEEETT